MERFEEFEHNLFKPPADERVHVWRYMDFTRFVSFLNSGTLHLTRCDQFDDHYEGAARQQDLTPHLPECKPDTPDRISVILATLWKKYQRQYVFINCWHISTYESAAMWRLYSRSNYTIAVQTTYAKLRNALPTGLHIGQVNYVDHQAYMSDEKSGFFSVMCKRKSFEHERELRICYIDSYEFQQDSKDIHAFFSVDNTRVFETVPVDVQSLVESVRVAPDAPDWLVKLVRDSIIRFGYDLPVHQSNFNEYPFL